MPFTLWQYAMAALLVGLMFGSWAYHYCRAEHHTWGHRWDETAMMALLLGLLVYCTAYAEGKTFAGVVWLIPWEMAFALSLLALPLGTALVRQLDAEEYTRWLAAVIAVPAVFSAQFLLWAPMLLMAGAAFVRGKDDNAVRHGWWHVGAALAVASLFILVR